MDVEGADKEVLQVVHGGLCVEDEDSRSER